MSRGTPAAFPIPARHISAIEMPSLKACKNALRPRKVSAYRRLPVSMSERPLFRSDYGIRQREIKYSQLIVGANTRVEVEHQKRQNSKYHRKQGQRRAMDLSLFAKPKISQSMRAGFPDNLLPLSRIGGSASLGSCLPRRRQSLKRRCAKSGAQMYGPAGAASKLGMPRSTLESKISSLEVNKNRFKAINSLKSS
jgi:hypothetical protein